MARPPTYLEFLRLLRTNTPLEYHEPFFRDAGGAIAFYRAWAKVFALLSARGYRAASRQLFRAPPGAESAGGPVRARMNATLRRTRDLDRFLLIEPGEFVMVGPRGRAYRSAVELRWYPNDPEPIRTIPLECDLIGEPGNLEWLGNDQGLVVEPDGTTPGLSWIDQANLSDQRSGVKATLTVGSGLATLTDTGKPPTFRVEDSGLYLRINYAGNLANVGRILRIVGYERSDVEVPAGSGLFPRTVILDDGLSPSLVIAAILDDGGVLTDYTAQAQSSEPNDFPLLPAAPAVNDAFYFAGVEPFGQLDLVVGTPRIGTLTVVWEYWDGALWQPLADVVDGTQGFSIEQLSGVSWTIPGGWAQTTIAGRIGYFVRARVSAFVDQTLQPLGTRAITLVAQPLAADPLDPQGNGQISWTVLDWRDLGVEVLEMTAPRDGRDDDLRLKLAERGVRRRPGETDEQLALRASRFPDVVTPLMIENEILRILEPYGVCAKLIDLGNAYKGTFWDLPPELAPEWVGAWDLYGPGDLFPIDKTLTVLSLVEAKWHFFVVVPKPKLGEFGAAWDEGPPEVFLPAPNTWLANAWDYAVLDGYPYLSAQLYAQVWQTVNEAREGGVRFTVIVGDVDCC